LVLLGIHTAFKEDLQASVVELIYGEPLRILAPTAHPVNPVHLITELSQYMACLRQVSAARHVSTATFVLGDLEKCTTSSSIKT
jgi:negative regulator of sigma E activity